MQAKISIRVLSMKIERALRYLSNTSYSGATLLTLLWRETSVTGQVLMNPVQREAGFRDTGERVCKRGETSLIESHSKGVGAPRGKIGQF